MKLYSLAVPLALSAALSWLDPATVQPRQKGVCITEWTLGQRVEIPVEVLGVLDAPGPERTSVLVRLVDERFAGSGVVAGMSGSPVYIDGKLLGAVAYGWAFAQEPLAGITPFSIMKDLQGGGASVSGTPPTVSQLAGVLSGAVEPLSVLPALAGARTGALTPVAVGGLGMPGDFGRTLLAGMGLEAVPAGVAVPEEGLPDARLPEAGEMIAAVLIWGDATFAAGGTVTARDGDRVWAFGHQLFALGGISVPAARARTIAIQGSYQSSFKVFGVGTPFGTFVADRPSGILAVAGAPPAGLPVRISLEEPLGKASWSFRVAEVPILEPLLITYLTNAALTARGAAAGDATARVALDLRFTDGRTASTVQTVRGPDALARIATFTGAVVGFFENSTFPGPRLASVDVRLERREELAGASIVEVLPERTVVRPGDTLHVAVRLAPHQRPETTVQMTVRVPRGAQPGPLDLIVADGAAWADYRMKALAVSPRGFEDQLELLAALEPNSTLVAALESHERGVSVAGRAQPSLPPSYAATLAIGLGRSNLVRVSSAIAGTSRWSAPYPLEGAFRIPLTVRAERPVVRPDAAPAAGENDESPALEAPASEPPTAEPSEPPAENP